MGYRRGHLRTLASFGFEESNVDRWEVGVGGNVGRDGLLPSGLDGGFEATGLTADMVVGERRIGGRSSQGEYWFYRLGTR